MNYYNEFDPCAAQWLRELMREGLIPEGDVDERDIRDVEAGDLGGYRQCHFFAGIGGWAYALSLAGVASDTPLWTGSPPCQPFSVAGKRQGYSDERHLWPAFFELIRECRPAILFGEQVASAIREGWFDNLRSDMEGEGYACGMAVLGAHSVGSPHIRQRMFFLAHADSNRTQRARPAEQKPNAGCEAVGGVGDTCCRRQDRQERNCGALGGAGQTRQGKKSEPWRNAPSLMDYGKVDWSSWQFIPGRDGKARPVPVESILLGCTDGLPGCVDSVRTYSGYPLTGLEIQGRAQVLKGYGNAIVPQVAAEFIAASMEAMVAV